MTQNARIHPAQVENLRRQFSEADTKHKSYQRWKLIHFVLALVFLWAPIVSAIFGGALFWCIVKDIVLGAHVRRLKQDEWIFDAFMQQEMADNIKRMKKEQRKQEQQKAVSPALPV